MTNPVVKQWTAALRSGEFAQGGPYRLQDDNGFSPLGVLCALATRAGVISSFGPSQDIPFKVQRWAQFRIPYCAPVSIEGMHDKGETFAKIADAIEANEDSLFSMAYEPLYAVQPHHPIVGQTLAAQFEDLIVCVVVQDIKHSYGHVRLLVTPVTGSGSQWIDRRRIVKSVEVA